MTTNDPLDISNYIADGFVKVCDVAEDDKGWVYDNINEDVMFSPHRSWVYFIVRKGKIVKCGETGNPLGIKTVSDSGQPIIGTKSRLGRYRRGPDTDRRVREALSESVLQNEVELWALKCDMTELRTTIMGVDTVTLVSYHKDLEMRYLDHFKQTTGEYPELNLCRK